MLEAHGYGDHAMETKLGTSMVSIYNEAPENIEVYALFEYTNTDESVMPTLV